MVLKSEHLRRRRTAARAGTQDLVAVIFSKDTALDPAVVKCNCSRPPPSCFRAGGAGKVSSSTAGAPQEATSAMDECAAAAV